jgi:lactoylglutathione lyase
MKEHYQGLGHVAIETNDLEGSIAFYQKLDGTLLKRDVTPDGTKQLALVDFGGVCLELIQPQEKVAPVSGSIPHFAVYVDDLDAVAAQIKAAGVDTFQTPEKLVMPETFGGLQTWFMEGPSGEIIELLQML